MALWLRRGRIGNERRLVATLVEGGYDPMEIAAAALRHVRGIEGQRPILPITSIAEPQQRRDGRERRSTSSSERPMRPQRESGVAETGMVSLSLSRGKSHGVRAGDVVSTLAFHASVPGHAIGKIRIQDHHTLVDVPERFVTQVLAKAANLRLQRSPVDVARA